MLTRIILATAVALSCGTARAEYLLGSLAFNTSLNPSSGTLKEAITLFNLKSTDGRTGFLSGLPEDTAWGSFQLNAPSAENQTISINDPGFGDFTGTVVTDTGEYTLGTMFSASLNRNITVEGLWAPGNNPYFGGDSGGRLAAITIALTRNRPPYPYTGNTAISAALTLQTFGNAAVPEPSTVVLSVTAAAVAAGSFIRRNRRSAATPAAT